MKIGDTRPVRPVDAATRRDREAAGRYSQAAALAPSEAPDSVSILGIPEAELTPKVRSAIMTLMREVEELRHELTQSQARLSQLERLADQDTLVPISNRRAFVRELGRLLSFSQRYDLQSSLIYIDLNGFKTVNDSFGHGAGDAALMHVANTLVANVRESDVVGRLGGDEFGVILAKADEKTAREKARTLAEAVAARPVQYDGQSFTLTVSYGIHTFGPGDDASEAMAAADREMYRQKAARQGEG